MRCNATGNSWWRKHLHLSLSLSNLVIELLFLPWLLVVVGFIVGLWFWLLTLRTIWPLRKCFLPFQLSFVFLIISILISLLHSQLGKVVLEVILETVFHYVLLESWTISAFLLKESGWGSQVNTLINSFSLITCSVKLNRAFFVSFPNSLFVYNLLEFMLEINSLGTLLLNFILLNNLTF